MKNCMKILAMSSLLSSTVVYADGDCGLEFKDENFTAISSEIGAKALDKHKTDFKSPTPKKGKKIPWTLDSKADIAEFVEDILKEKAKATRDDKTKLSIETKKLTDERVAWWEGNTGTFVVFNPKDEDCGTAYRPDKGKKEYEDAS